MVRGGIVTVPQCTVSGSALSTPRISFGGPNTHVQHVGTSGWYCGQVGAEGTIPGWMLGGYYREGAIPGTNHGPAADRYIGIARAQRMTAGRTVSPLGTPGPAGPSAHPVAPAPVADLNTARFH